MSSSEITNYISEFRKIQFSRDNILNGITVNDILCILKNIENSQIYKDFTTNMDSLYNHLVNFDNPHNFTVEQLVESIFEILYENWLLEGNEGDIDIFKYSLFTKLVTSEPNDIYNEDSEITSNIIILVNDLFNIVRNHNISDESHYDLFNTYFNSAIGFNTKPIINIEAYDWFFYNKDYILDDVTQLYRNYELEEMTYTDRNFTVALNMNYNKLYSSAMEKDDSTLCLFGISNKGSDNFTDSNFYITFSGTKFILSSTMIEQRNATRFNYIEENGKSILLIDSSVLSNSYSDELISRLEVNSRYGNLFVYNNYELNNNSLVLTVNSTDANYVESDSYNEKYGAKILEYNVSDILNSLNNRTERILLVVSISDSIVSMHIKANSSYYNKESEVFSIDIDLSKCNIDTPYIFKYDDPVFHIPNIDPSSCVRKLIFFNEKSTQKNINFLTYTQI